jgi:hypothetical protein
MQGATYYPERCFKQIQWHQTVNITAVTLIAGRNYFCCQNMKRRPDGLIRQVKKKKKKKTDIFGAQVSPLYLMKSVNTVFTMQMYVRNTL